jgi:hypothetical protein
MLPGLTPTAPDAPAEPHSPVQQAASPEQRPRLLRAEIEGKKVSKGKGAKATRRRSQSNAPVAEEWTFEEKIKTQKLKDKVSAFRHRFAALEF